MLTPVFRYLANYTGRPVDYIGRGPWSRQLLSGQPAIGDVAQIHSKRLPLALNADKQRLVRWLRARRDRLVLDLESDEQSQALMAAAGVPSANILRDCESVPDKSYRHQVSNTLARVRMALEGHCDLADLDQALSLDVPDPWREDAQAWLTRRGWSGSRLILAAPGNKRTMSWRPYWRSSNRKHWPLTHWARLCNRLLEEACDDTRVLLVGAPAEQRLARFIVDASGHPRVHAVADEMPTTRMLALMARARGAITLDSGPAHAAAALDCPVVALFNATDPDKFMPLAASGRVQAVTPAGANPGRVEIDAVVRSWRELQERDPVSTAPDLPWLAVG